MATITCDAMACVWGKSVSSEPINVIVFVVLDVGTGLFAQTKIFFLKIPNWDHARTKLGPYTNSQNAG